MSLVVANSADLGPAMLALANLPTMLHRDVVGLDPHPAILAYTIDPILGLILQKLAIPILLEVLTEQLVDVLEINMIICAAARWHMSWIGD
jgi:hypothetical protein